MVGQLFSDRYELVRLIARGGMAEVYLARDRRLDRPVAVKVLSAEFARDPSFVERFRREAQGAANLNHPHLVSIFDWGQEEGTYFIVMEYVEGESLKDLLREQGALEPAEAARIGGEIAAALAYAHRNGVVHRDVKPANVLLTKEHQVKVADLGIALADTSEALTQTGSVMGTATYFSPEQAQGKAVDGRSDVYSLGIVLYEMVTGAPPFSGGNPVSVAYQHVREPPEPPSEKTEGLPADYERIVLTALAKDPAGRYGSAEEIRGDLVRFQAGQTLQGAAVTALVGAADDTSSATVAGPALTETTLVEPVEEPAAKRRRRGVAIAAVVAAIILLGVVTLILLTGNRDGTGTQVAVPGVVGFQFEEARDLLEGQGFEVERQNIEDEAEEGIVVRQNPTEGAEVAEGSTVTLFVSGGIPQVEVPDVSGLLETDAFNLIRREDLQPERRPEPSDDVEEGRVIRTEPVGGTMVERKSVVEVFISTGPAPVQIPPVAGLTAAEARSTLSMLGFQVVETLEESESVDEGRVIRTNPPEGDQAQRGSTVEIFVSTGPGTATVPSVIGMTEAQATALLGNEGFVANVVQVPSLPANEGIVLTQSPAGNTTQQKGSTVTISVGDGLL